MCKIDGPDGNSLIGLNLRVRGTHFNQDRFLISMAEPKADQKYPSPSGTVLSI
jgi:hypothetical protein